MSTRWQMQKGFQKIHCSPESGGLLCAGRLSNLGRGSRPEGNLSAALGTHHNELKLTAHRLLIDDEGEMSSFLLEPRPRLKLLSNTIDVEADDLLEAKKVNRELLLRCEI